MSLSCLFCRIAKREIPAELLEETDDFVAFKDTNPQAPVHVLIIPREHIGSLSDASESHASLLGQALMLAPKLAKRLGMETGFRVVIISDAEAGQTVFHLQIHPSAAPKY